jgi:hypothetical protein
MESMLRTGPLPTIHFLPLIGPQQVFLFFAFPPAILYNSSSV